MKLTTYLINEAVEALKDWNKYVRRNKMLASAVTVLKKITKSKYKAYIVGGAVRDIVLGNKPKDVDIATNMPIDELAKLWKLADIGKSKDFGIVIIKEGGQMFEVAQFREDGKYIDGRRPESVKVTGSFEKDVARRDFTINAMGIDIKGNIIDYFDGRKDIKDKILRTVGDPMKRFSEDKLRIMRAARFSAQHDLSIDPATEKAAKRLSKEISQLPMERIKDEIFKAAKMQGSKFAVYLQILDKFKVLRHILPELVSLKVLQHSPAHHPESPTVWGHLMAALKVSKTSDPIKNLAILLHDVGKSVTGGMKEGVPTYYGHAEAGVKLVNSIADRLRMSTKEKQSLLFAVGNHMKFHDVLKMKPSKVAKLVNDENWDVLLAVAQADSWARGPEFKHYKKWEEMIDHAIAIKKKWGIPQVRKVNSLVDGNKIMKLTGLKPGPKIGEIKNKALEWVVDNNITDEQEIENKIRELAS